MRARSLQDLQQIREEMRARAAREALEAAAREEAERRARAEREMFQRAVGPMQRLPAHGRALPAAPKPAPVALQRQRDEEAVLREAISDEFDATTLLEVDGALSFARPGVGPDVTARLRRGHWAVQRQIDLHGLRTDEAREALGSFLREARRAGLRCVRVVHGKGLGSPGRTPVLKAKVHAWLIQKADVLAFVQARPLEGGAGALLVLLAPAQTGR